MTLTVVRHADVLVTMDDGRREIADGAVAFRDGVIEAVGSTTALDPLAANASTVIDARGCVVTPGLVNTHHHLYQSLTRAVPGATGAPLFDWLKRLYPIWARYRPEDVFVATQLGLAELALSGCTLTSDHLYLFPNGTTLDDTIEAARTIGLRFHPTRGAMSVGESKGGLPPDSLVEAEPAILSDTIRVIDRYHDPADGAMVRVGVAPCSPFSVSEGLMRDAAALARDKGVMLHTHLAEDEADVAYSLDRFGCRPGDYAEQLGWTGPDVWHAHCVRLQQDEIALFARTRTGIAHCPCSNGRLGSGIAPLVAMLAEGVSVGLGVDGSASNERSHLFNEVKQALLVARGRGGPTAMSARAAIRLGTRGGAAVLGRGDIGAVAPGKCADLAVWTTDGLELAGAADPVAGLVFAGAHRVDRLYVGGELVVQGGALVRADEAEIARAHRAQASRFAQ